MQFENEEASSRWERGGPVRIEREARTSVFLRTNTRVADRDVRAPSIKCTVSLKVHQYRRLSLACSVPYIKYGRKPLAFPLDCGGFFVSTGPDGDPQLCFL